MHLRKKYIETLRSTEGPSLMPKNQSANMVFPKTVFGKKKVDQLMLIGTASFSGFI